MKEMAAPIRAGTLQTPAAATSNLSYRAVVFAVLIPLRGDPDAVDSRDRPAPGRHPARPCFTTVTTMVVTTTVVIVSNRT